MYRLYKRNGVYWIQFRGRRRSLRTRDRTAAELAAKLIERRAADPTYRPKDNTTLGRALKDFRQRQEERGRAPGTLRMYDAHIGHLARVLDEHSPLASIDAAEVDRYLSTRHGEGAEKTTQWKELCTLRGTLKLARRHKKYPHALDEVMPHDFEQDAKIGEAHLTEPQIAKLLAVLPPHRSAVCAFIVATAADWRSVEDAKRADVDLEKGLALVRGTKNRNRWRTVPILEPFRAWLEQSLPYMPFAPWGNVRRDLEVACRKAGVPKVTPRDLRRSHSQALRSRGIDPQLIAGMLGHADSRMVERVYGKLTPEALKAVIGQRLDGTEPVQKRRAKSKTSKEPRK